MAVDTAVDAELWLIFAAMIGWIVLGCFLTAHDRHHAPAPAAPEAWLPSSKRREARCRKVTRLSDLAPLSSQARSCLGDQAFSDSVAFS